jgi:hypothetical protein
MVQTCREDATRLALMHRLAGDGSRGRQTYNQCCEQMGKVPYTRFRVSKMMAAQIFLAVSLEQK